MLVLQRKVGESIYIGDDVLITLQDISGDRVKISIDAPREISIVRKELIDAAKQNEEAKESKQIDVNKLTDFFK